jgi:hypothetical protein
LKAPLFCDASGDGIVAFQSGASFRMGAESPGEFDEGFAPDVEDYGELLGHSLYFYTKDIGRPVSYVAPSYALKNVDILPAIKKYSIKDHGCFMWWVEYGGRLDTNHQSEDIKWTLWSVVYGLWDYVKNSGNYPEAENLTLEWVGTIPGKRESRRFIGDYILTQRDIVGQKCHYDAVAYGGWAMDLHPADGVLGDKQSCNQWHSKGIYQIPYRCYYSKDIANLFIAGRIISASHVAFGSSRVMATCAHGAQVVGMAAALATQLNLKPGEIAQKEHIQKLQSQLNRQGQSIPQISLPNPGNRMNDATLKASSILSLSVLPADGSWRPLETSTAQLLPLQKGTAYTFNAMVKIKKTTLLTVQLRKSSKRFNYTPDVILEELELQVHPGQHDIELPFTSKLDTDQYAFLCFLANKQVEIKTSQTRISGIVSVFNTENKAVSNAGVQRPPEGLGIDSFEFWIPERRPGGENLALTISPGIDAFRPENLTNGFTRPDVRPNAFVAALDEKQVTIDVHWKELQEIREIVLHFDTDFDHPMESSLWGHHSNTTPFCVNSYQIRNCGITLLTAVSENYQTINRFRLHQAIRTRHLQFIIEQPDQNVPCALFEIQCF